MHISSLDAKHDAANAIRTRPARLSGLACGAVIALFAFSSLPAHAQSFFGSIDPFNTKGKVAPTPNQRWIPDDALPLVPPPTSLQSIPADLNRPVSLAELTEIALILNIRTRQAWLQARVEAAQSGVDHAGDFPTITGVLADRIGRPLSGTSGF